MDKYYYVKQGDTLYDIAEKFGTTADVIMKANNLKFTSLSVGQRLVMPLPALPTGILGPSSRGEGVRSLQYALIYLGYLLAANGFYDENTEYLIRSIQKKYPERLKDDGIYGPKTKAVIQEMLNNGYQIIQNPGLLLVLVNKTHALPPFFVPVNLTTPDIPAAAGYQLRQDAAKALENLFTKAKSDNISLFGVSGYRPYDRQAALFAANVSKNPNANLTSARPGESEHQTGLSTDISSPSANYELTERFGRIDTVKWLEANAPQFGFIIRYPRGSEARTGYAYEPWHIRYVGKEAAQKMAMMRMVLEDYLKA